MTKLKLKLRFSFVSLVVLAMASVLSPSTAAAQSRPAPAGQKAGTVSALLPVAKFYRGSARNPVVTDAKKGDDVLWNDMVRTEKGGRARITLNDQSILSLGSQAELRVVKHDSRSQQTALQLGYGRVRAEVAAVTRDGGRFELRTPTAVAGVIGTDFGSDASIPGVTSFICISGIVQVSNSDPNVGGMVPCPAGSTTEVKTGMAPTAPKPATQQQIQQLIQDTEPAVISALSPAASLPGLTLATTVSGSKMTGINQVSISGTGITVALAGTPTDTSATVSITLDANAAPGARTITFTKSNGQTTAAVFTVLAPPSTAVGTVDLNQLKKAYVELIEAERQSEITGLNAIGLGVQQSAADTLQQLITENNKLPSPLPQSQIEKELGDTVNGLLTAMAEAGKKVNDEAAAATNAYNTQADAAFARVPEGPGRAEALSKAAKDVFDRVNQELTNRFKGIHDGLGGTAKSTNAHLNAASNRWLNQIRQELARQPQVPTPKVDAEERSYDVGVFASFDAARSTGTGSASIASYNWVLCDPSYKPQAIGVVLPANAPGCRPISGYTATSNEFKFQTCQLPPTDYIARVTVTDTNGKSSAMDVRLRVNQPQYEGPAERTRSLADAYQALQPQQFLNFFDANFSGLTQLQENMRRTFESLASMNINLRVSQATISCNEATVRADWEQKYTFKADQTCANVPNGETCQRVVFNQTEQLTMRMVRQPGRGWFISEFQGDNGTVQGVPPGPRIVDTALPDLELNALTLFSTPQAAKENSAAGVAPGLNTFEAVVKNTGNGALTTASRVRFSVRDLNNNEISFVITELPAPLAPGATASVLGQLNVPDLGAGTPARITAVVNGGCIIQEKNCDGQNIKLVDVIIGTVDLSVANLATVGTLVGTVPGQVTVQITNSGTRASVPSLGNLQLVNTTTGTVIGAGNIPSIPIGATVTVPINFTVPNTPGTLNVTVRINPASVAETNTANDSTTGTISIVAPVVNLAISSLAYPAGGTPPFLSGQTRGVTFNVTNTGNAPSSPSDTKVCTLSGGTAGNFAPVAIPSVLPGQTITGVGFVFTVPVDFAGSRTLTCTLSQDPFEPSSTLANNSATLTAVINPNVDLQLVNVPTPDLTQPDQMGETGNVVPPFQVQNFGLDTAPAGWNVVLRMGGVTVGSYTHTTTLAGGASTTISTITYTTPNLAPPPVDQTFPVDLTVNQNNAVVETNTANNQVARTIRLIDFTATVARPTLNLISGVSANEPGMLSILPVPNPNGYTVTYVGLPAGLTAGGTNGNSIVGASAATGSFPVTANVSSSGVTHAASGTITINIAAAASDLSVILTNTSGSGPFLSGQTINFNVALTNNGNVANTATTYACTFNGVGIGSGSIGAIPAGTTVTQAKSLIVPTNQAPTGNIVCNITPASNESVTTNNTGSFSVSVNPNIDLEVVGILAPTPAIQYGATNTYNIQVRNNGLDNAPSGWSVDVAFNAQPLATVNGVAVSGGQTVTLTPNIAFTGITGLGPAPFDISAPTGLGAALTLGGVADTNNANNVINTAARVVDFTLTVLTPTLNALQSQAFTANNVIQINPGTYPLPINVSYTGLPAGFAASGTNGTGISGSSASTGSFPVGASATVNGITHSTSGITLNVNAAFTDLVVSIPSFNPGPWTAGQTKSLNLQIGNTGNVASFSFVQKSCTLNGITIISSSNVGVINPGASTTFSLSFTVPANQAPTGNIVCTVTQDPNETNTANNTNSFSVTVDPSIDLEVISVTPPAAAQLGATYNFDMQVRNNGLDTAPTGWDARFSINGGNQGGFAGPSVPSLGVVTVTASIPVAAITGLPAAPFDTNATLQGFLGLNAVVPDTNFGNNSITVPLRIVDFTLTDNSGGPLRGVQGRAFSKPSIVLVDPPSYPLPLTIAPAGTPAGLTWGGTPFGQDLTGTPSTTGTAFLGASATVDGVSHSMPGIITINLDPEITMSLGTAFSLTQNGSPAPFQVNFTGGVNGTINYTLNLPVGITVASGPPISGTVSSGGSLTWQLQANGSATTGASLTNINVHATDAGFPATGTAAGNVDFNPSYSLSAAPANYAITSAILSNHSGGSTGAASFVMGESIDVDVAIQNTGGTTETGIITATASIPGITGPFATGVSAPAAGQTNHVTITIPITGPNGFVPTSYSKTINLTFGAGLTDANAADNSAGPFAFDVFDFGFVDISGFTTPQNVPITGSSSFDYNLVEFGPAAPQPIGSIAVFPVPAGVSYSFNPTASPSTQTVTINTSGAATNSTITTTVGAARYAQTRTLTHDFHFYSGTIDNTDSGDPGDTSGTAITLVKNGPAVQGNFHLISDFDIGSSFGTLSITTPAGITAIPVGSVSLNNGDFFQINFSANNTAATGPQLLTIKVQVPNTNPVQYITHQFYVQPTDAPDIAVNTITGTGTFARDLNSSPILAGEGGDFTVNIQNLGSAATSGGQRLSVRIGSPFGTEIGSATITTIGPGSNTNVNVHVHMPDPLPTSGVTGLYFVADADTPLESNTLNNQGNIGVTTSDWSLGSSSGSAAAPIVVSFPGPGTANTSIIVQIANVGNKGATINLDAAFDGAPGNGSITSFLSQIGLPATLTGSTTAQAVFLQVQTSPQAPNGYYAITVFGDLVDGAIHTRRQFTVGIQVVGSSAGGTVSMASDQLNLNTGNYLGNPAGCFGPCTNVVQINGLSVVSANITPTGGTGTTDLVFTDDGNHVVSRVDSGGSQLSPYVTAAPYGSPLSVNFAAQEISEGVVNTGPGQVVISAVASTQAAGRDAIVPVLGSQQFTLFFNVGDLSISTTPSCIEIPAGQTVAVQVNFSAAGGYNANTNYNFLGLAVQSMFAAESATGTIGAPYSSLTFNITNPSNNINGSTPVVFRIQPQGTTTNVKDFAIPMHLNSNSECTAGASRQGASREGAAAMASVGTDMRGRWYRHAPSYSAVASRAPVMKAPVVGLPDLQLSQKDVSYTPSIPKRGDTVNVTFKVANLGDADAIGVPIALQVSGKIVATDTFDLKAGSSTLAGLTWTDAQPSVDAPVEQRGSRGSRVRGGEIQMLQDGSETVTGPRGARMQFNALLVVDPAGTTKQKSALNKSAQVSRLSVGTPTDNGSGVTGGMDRAFLEVGTTCIGFRIASGSGGDCESGADVDITMNDLAAGRFSINAEYGIADLGAVDQAAAEAAVTNAEYGAHAAFQVGHTYAVQLAGGKHGIFTVGNMFNPKQLAQEAKKYFGTMGVKIIRRMGGESNILQIGDVAASYRDGDPLVYFDLRFKVIQ